MFHFPAFPPHTLCVQVWVTPHDWCRVSPFGHPGITARLTAPPGLSRPPTSFIGSQCQGIHHAPLNTYNTDKPNKEKNCTSNTHNKHPPTRKPATISCVLDARNHYPQIKHHTPPPKMEQQQTPLTTGPQHLGARGLTAGHLHQRRGSAGPVVSKPNSVSGSPAPPKRESTEKVC